MKNLAGLTKEKEINKNLILTQFQTLSDQMVGVQWSVSAYEDYCEPHFPGFYSGRPVGYLETCD